jgi:queuosine precursor transporter
MGRTALSSKCNRLLVALYLAAIVAANLSVTYFGAGALGVTAFLLIPFDLCARDLLHEQWQGHKLTFCMGLLILAGSVLSFVVSPASFRVSLGSALAFGAGAIVDTGVYAMAHALRRFWKMNLSNLFSSVTDSLIFPLVAFGGTTFNLSAGQALAKFCGGLFWSSLFVWFLRRRRLRVETGGGWTRERVMRDGG